MHLLRQSLNRKKTSSALVSLLQQDSLDNAAGVGTQPVPHPAAARTQRGCCSRRQQVLAGTRLPWVPRLAARALRFVSSALGASAQHGLGSKEQSQINAFPLRIIPSRGHLSPGEGQQRVKASGDGGREEPRCCEPSREGPCRSGLGRAVRRISGSGAGLWEGAAKGSGIENIAFPNPLLLTGQTEQG